MAKMNKSEAVHAAKNLACRDAEVAAMTVEQINALDYTMLRCAARNIAMKQDVIVNDPTAKYYSEAVDAFVNQAMNIWTGKVTPLKRARESFIRACTGLTTQQAEEKIQALLTSMNIRGARVEQGRMEVLRGARDGATLFFRFDREDGDTVNPDATGHRAYRYALRVEISVAGTSYSPARMALVCKIQQELLDAANEIEALFERERVVFVYGGKEEAHAVTEAMQS